MSRATPLVVPWLLLAPATTLAEPDTVPTGEVGAVATRVLEVGPWSTDLLDPSGLTRFHIVSRGTFSDGDGVFTSATSMSYEARAHVGVAEGFAIGAVLPVGHVSRPGAASSGFLGNLALGATFGGTLSTRPGLTIRLGGGLDTYLPTTPEAAEGTIGLARSTVAAIRSSEPQLYVPELFSVRGRAHVDVTAGMFTGELELGLVPGGTVGRGGVFVLLASASARGSARVTPAVEPFLEIGASRQLAGDGEIAPPLLITPGVRFHIADAFDPSIFLSLNFVEASALVVGLDLATVIRPTLGGTSRREQDPDDFLGDF